MKNVAFHYIYRDGANYKNFHAEIFKNLSGMNIEDIRLLIKQKFIGEEYFYAAELQVPDLHLVHGMKNLIMNFTNLLR